MSEIIFFDTAGDMISGEIIGADGSFENNGNAKEKAFDWDVLAFWDLKELGLLLRFKP